MRDLAVWIGVLLASPVARAAPGAPLAEAWVSLGPGESPQRLAEAGLDLTEEHEVGPDGATRWRLLLAPGDDERLAALGLVAARTREDHRLGAPPPGYHPPEVGDAWLAELADRSSRGWLATLGRSLDGRPITGLALGQPPGSGAPGVRLLGAHHGDEWTSFELVLAAAEALVDGDGTDERVTRILDRSTVWLVPYVNPDGVMAGDRHNAAGIDLNRNYDFEWSATTRAGGPRPFSEPETRAIRAHGQHERPLVSLSLHAGAANLGWPWNWSPVAPPDEATLILLAERYARACSTDGFWITQGSDWYETRGDTNDWSYGRYGALDLTLEASWDRAPPPQELPATVDEHLDALLGFLDTGPTVSGEVRDAATGAAVEAEVRVERPAGDAPVWSDPVTGAFHRLLGPGTARLTISAPGYAPASVTVDPGVDAPALVEVALAPVAVGVGRLEPSVARSPGEHRLPRPSASVTLVRAGAEPVELPVTGDAVWLDPTDLAGGWWTAVLDDGVALRDAVWIDEPEGAALTGWSLRADDVVEVDGAGFATGTRAWGSDGASTVAVEVLEESDTRLLLSVEGLPRDRRVDLGIWTAGAHLGADDLWNARSLADEQDFEPLRALGGCACAAGSGHQETHGMSILLGMLALWAPRRRRS